MAGEGGSERARGESREATFEVSITALVRSAPVLDAAVIESLANELRAIGSPLARSIARVIELVGAGRIDPGIALPALAMACATLADGLRGKLPEASLEAARFEIDTLLPLPDKAPRVAEPDVLLSRVLRRQT
jgi:hypothetical protein